MTSRWNAGLAAVALLLSALASPRAQAGNPLDDLVAPVLGRSACFSRVYDDAHLKKNPRQKTTSMVVWLKYVEGGGTADPVLGLGLAVRQRGDAQPLFGQGACNWEVGGNRDLQGRRVVKSFTKNAGGYCAMFARPDVFETLSAEEGGEVMTDRGKDRDTLMVYLDDGLLMVRRGDRNKQLDIAFGADDRIFLLRRTDAKDCDPVQDAVTTPEPGVRAR